MGHQLHGRGDGAPAQRGVRHAAQIEVADIAVESFGTGDAVSGEPLVLPPGDCRVALTGTARWYGLPQSHAQVLVSAQAEQVLGESVSQRRLVQTVVLSSQRPPSDLIGCCDGPVREYVLAGEQVAGDGGEMACHQRKLTGVGERLSPGR
ncbi:hypothetical protein GCM10029963_75740 [Micromonospora andamanensis]